MKQQQTTDEKKSGIFNNLKEKFEKISSQPATREVKLIYQSCCGCGCHDTTVVRTVPYDSSLKNGDRISSLEKGDKQL